jgi:hypothetical protein
MHFSFFNCDYSESVAWARVTRPRNDMLVLITVKYLSINVVDKWQRTVEDRQRVTSTSTPKNMSQILPYDYKSVHNFFV